MDKGKVIPAGQGTYVIELMYGREHSVGDCGTCNSLRNRSTGRDYIGLREIGNAIDYLTDYYSYEIRNSARLTHAGVISLVVWQKIGHSRQLIETYQIRKG